MIFDTVKNSVVRAIAAGYNATHWFTDAEAWKLYKLFAFLEAAGWSMLIAAIVYRSYDLPGYAIAVSLAGRMHGLFFSLYFVSVILTARSMKWGFWRIVGALLAGMPPYSSLLYERIMASDRSKHPVYVEPPAGSD